MVVLGGAFFASGNVNPAAEANVKEWTPNSCDEMFGLYFLFYILYAFDYDFFEVVFLCLTLYLFIFVICSSKNMAFTM